MATKKIFTDENGQYLGYKINAAIAAEAERATAAEEANAEAIAELKESVESLTSDDASSLSSLIAANASAIETLNGDSSTDGSVAKSIADYVGDGTITITQNGTSQTFGLNDDEGTTIELTDTTYSVADGDMVLTLDGTAFSATLGLTYTAATEEENATIALTGINDEVIASIDASDFIADGMLSSVEYDTTEKVLTFTWNTTAGGTVTTISVSDLVDTYTAGDGLSVSSNKFSVVVDSSSEEYLSVSESGVKVSGISDAISAAAAAATTVVAVDGDATHISVTPTTDADTGATTYTISESDIASAEAVETLTATVSTNTSAIEVLNGDSTTEGSVAYAIAQVSTTIESKIEALDGRVTDLENAEGFTEAEIDAWFEESTE